MKTLTTCLLVIAALIYVAALGDDRDVSKPQGMSLRLELFVDDMDKSIEFYTKVLGFERLKGGKNYVPVQSGSVVIGLGPAEYLPEQHHFNPELQTGRRGLGTEIVLEVDDVRVLFNRVDASGHKILTPLRKRSWGATDFRIADPDGYYLRLTSR